MQTISIALETSPEQPPLTGQETAMVKPLSVKLRLNKREEREIQTKQPLGTTFHRGNSEEADSHGGG